MVSMLIVVLPLALAVCIRDDACACHDDVWIACMGMRWRPGRKIWRQLGRHILEDMAPAGAPYLGRYGASWGAISRKIWRQLGRHIVEDMAPMEAPYQELRPDLL